MTKEEIAIIEAAYDNHRGCAAETCGGTYYDKCKLGNAIDALVNSCEECNSGGHVCYGDGAPIPHGAGSCGEHDDPITDEQKRLADYLGEYATDVVHEWMRIVELNGDVTEPDSGSSQARATWYGGGEFTLGSSQYSEDMGHFRLHVRVQPLYVPPVGPENDPALIEELKSEPEWTETTWIHVLPGDSIRLPGKTQVATVLSLHIGDWHADVKSRLMESGKWWDSVAPWDHKEVSVRLEHMPERLLAFGTGAPVEILMNEERRAVYVLQGAFPGSERVDP